MPKTRVLVVDDDKYVCDVIKLMLEKKGCEAIIVSDANQVLDKVEIEQPDIVLLDIMLPDISGLELLKALKDNPKTKKIPVIMVTGKKDYESMVSAKGLLADDYLAKPFLSDELIKIISKYLK